MTTSTTTPTLSLFERQATVRRPAPVNETVTRERLVAGLRAVFQRARVELALTTARKPDREYLLAVASVLCDVAREFGLTTTRELQSIVAEYATELIGTPEADA